MIRLEYKALFVVYKGSGFGENAGKIKLIWKLHTLCHLENVFFYIFTNTSRKEVPFTEWKNEKQR
jgi:hypothetical protein